MKFRTVNAPITVRKNIKKSIFIGSLSPAEDVFSAKNFIEEIKSAYRNANHNAYCFRVGVKSEQVFYSDDGEPSRTAGLPIFNAIRSADLTNVVMVVSRFFGGIKLGVPGLIEAYGETSRFAIENAEIVEETVKVTFQLSFAYNELQFVNYAIGKFSGEVIQKQFGENIEFTVRTCEEISNDFKEFLLQYGHYVTIK
ncbi:MAG: IMPACT family protein [Caldisericaceae bacterium]